MIRFASVPPIVQGECRVVAEVGNPPTVKAALELAEAAAAAGAWGVKAQLLTADTLVTATARTYSHGLTEPTYQAEAFAEALPYEAWAEVKARCDELGVLWFASCWDFAAVDACEEMGVELYKVGSADITHRPLLEYIAATGKPVVLSTGGATGEEILQAVTWMRQATGRFLLDLVVLACTLSYPCAEEDANVARVGTLRGLGYPLVGYSDHTRGYDASLAAAGMDAVMIEKHFTTTPNTGADHDFAADESVLSFMTMTVPGRSLRADSRVLGDGRLSPMPSEQKAVHHARRSIVAATDLHPGDSLEGNITWLRPGTGLPPWFDVTGITAATMIPAWSTITHRDIG